MPDAAINPWALPEQHDPLITLPVCSARTVRTSCSQRPATALRPWCWIRFFRLDADKFKQFTAMLDAPPGPNAGLERLMAVKAPWSTGAA